DGDGEPACDDGLHNGDETDIDCGGGCTPCTLGQQCVVGNDCATLACNGGLCAFPLDCKELHALNPDLGDGDYDIDPDGDGVITPFPVSCDMVTDGGGWIRLSLNHTDGVVVSENAAAPENPWDKCEDDSAKHFDWITEDDVTPDYSPGGNSINDVDLVYRNPSLLSDYTAAQIEALRDLISELHPTTRIVALTSDDDNGGYQNNLTTGHEVYLKGKDPNWFLLTPGEDGNCGGGAGTWPTPGSASGYYLWSHDAASSVVDGQTGLTDDDLQGLDVGALLPYKVRLVVQTGGGVAFGWEREVFLVR
ncbi:MAG: hypothetical protein KC468_13215, partial [Myxococcales bacterium]|nr:hypothetical protein [Myxococcales bacterium]